jgi:hypothetical protein
VQLRSNGGSTIRLVTVSLPLTIVQMRFLSVLLFLYLEPHLHKLNVASSCADETDNQDYKPTKPLPPSSHSSDT